MQPLSFRFAILSLTALMLAQAAPVHAQQDAEAYEYDVHYATSPATGAGVTPSEPEDVAIRHALQGPGMALLWNEEEKRTPENARLARHEEVLGLFMPKWSIARSASEATGWTAVGRAIQYDRFLVDFRRGDDDRTVAGHPATHYVFEAHITRQVEGSARKQRYATTTDVWVLEDRPFSWVPFAVFGTTGVNADPRLQVALAERLAERGMVARAETRLSFEMLPEDGTANGAGSEQRFLVWVEGVKPAAPPQLEAPVATWEAAEAFQKAVGDNPQAFCKAVLEGSTPAVVREAFPAEQQAVLMQNASSQCQ